MGVRFYDGKENMSTTTRTYCNCNTCNQQTSSSSTTATSSNNIKTQTTRSLNDDNYLNFQKTGILREIVGNRKEVRIEDNAHNLRIVGNNNRIRISINMGDITIIGNNTRLKITTNHGLIKYTGNDGRISLGKDSTEQLVDYSGCNGVLKVQNSKKNSNQVNDDEYDGKIKNNTMGNTNNIYNSKLNASKSKTAKEKYASFSGSPSGSDVFKYHMDYNNLFNRKKSMPNLKTKAAFSESVSGPYAQSIIHNFGNIVISNSFNVCVFPHSHA